MHAQLDSYMVNTEKRIAHKITPPDQEAWKHNLRTCRQTHRDRGSQLSEEDLQKCNKIGDDVKVLMETLKFWYRTAGDSKHGHRT